MKRILVLSGFRTALLSFFIVLSTFSVKAVDGSFYVGEGFFLDNPNTPGRIDAIAWYSDRNNDISISKNNGGASVIIEQYFSGTATIECQYGYTYYVGSTRKHGTGHGYFTVACKKSEVVLNKKEITVAPGAEFQLTYTNSSGFKVPVPAYKTDDKSIAKLDRGEWGYGDPITVKAINPGTCTITFYAKCGGDNPTCKVTVKDTPAKGIEVQKETLMLKKGKSGYLKYKLIPEDATSSVTWKSNDETIAKVTSKGYITAVSEGVAIITATTDNGYKATGKVEVMPLPTFVGLESPINVVLGFSRYITPALLPKNSSSSFYWSVGDNSIARIYSSGLVQGLSIGTTTITVKTENNLEAVSKINVIEPEPGMSIEVVKPKVQEIKRLIDKSMQCIK